MADFRQATIAIEKQKEFEELKDAVSRVFAAAQVEEFLKRLQEVDTRVRNWESVLSKGVLDKVDQVLARSKTTAQQLYQSLPVSDQAQMREFYLSKIETVEAQLRHKFRKLYQYY